MSACGYARHRDTSTRIYFLSQISCDGGNWALPLANCGLHLMSCAQCLVTIVSGSAATAKCVRVLDAETGSNHLPDSPEPAGSFYSTSSKELLVSNWLGQQRRHNMLLMTQPPVSHMASQGRPLDEISDGIEIMRYRQPPPPLSHLI